MEKICCALNVSKLLAEILLLRIGLLLAVKGTSVIRQITCRFSDTILVAKWH